MTLRHLLLKLLVWAKATCDSPYIDQRKGCVHLIVKIMADGRDLEPTDMLLSSTKNRQHTLGELCETKAGPFKLSRCHPTSKSPLAFRSSENTIASHPSKNAAESGVKRLVYLHADERKDLGSESHSTSTRCFRRQGRVCSAQSSHPTILLYS